MFIKGTQLVGIKTWSEFLGFDTHSSTVSPSQTYNLHSGETFWDVEGHRAGDGASCRCFRRDQGTGVGLRALSLPSAVQPCFLPEVWIFFSLFSDSVTCWLPAELQGSLGRACRAEMALCLSCLNPGPTLCASFPTVDPLSVIAFQLPPQSTQS